MSSKDLFIADELLKKAFDLINDDMAYKLSEILEYDCKRYSRALDELKEVSIR